MNISKPSKVLLNIPKYFREREFKRRVVKKGICLSCKKFGFLYLDYSNLIKDWMRMGFRKKILKLCPFCMGENSTFAWVRRNKTGIYKRLKTEVEEDSSFFKGLLERYSVGECYRCCLIYFREFRHRKLIELGAPEQIIVDDYNRLSEKIEKEEPKD